MDSVQDSTFSPIPPPRKLSNPHITHPHDHNKPRNIELVFVIETSAQMSLHFPFLYQNYIELVLRQCQRPIFISDGEKERKIMPKITLGLVTYGDYPPFSSSTITLRSFEGNYVLLREALLNINFCDGGMLKNAVLEGLMASLKFFRVACQQSHNALPPLRHCILVSSTPPYPERLRVSKTNAELYTTAQVCDALSKENINLSLICCHKGLTELVEIVKLVNKHSVEPSDTPLDHDVRLIGFKLPIKKDFGKKEVSKSPVHTFSAVSNESGQPSKKLKIAEEAITKKSEGKAAITIKGASPEEIGLVSSLENNSSAMQPKTSSQKLKSIQGEHGALESTEASATPVSLEAQKKLNKATNEAHSESQEGTVDASGTSASPQKSITSQKPSPIWKGNLVWKVRSQKNQSQGIKCEISIHPFRVGNISHTLEEYNAGIWPKELNVTGAAAIEQEILQKAIKQRNLPLVTVHATQSSNGDNEKKLAIVAKQLATQKLTAFMRFENLNGNFGMALIWKTKLIGILFLTTPFNIQKRPSAPSSAASTPNNVQDQK